MATHADLSLRLIENPTALQKTYLGPWRYQDNPTVLHTDTSLLPRNYRAHASWNYTREPGEDGKQPLSISYDMTRLQGLPGTRRYLVTLNPRKPFAAGSVIREIQYRHPSYSLDAAKYQKLLPELNREGPVKFCGSYFGFGFHEDAVRSAVELCTHYGVSW
jgi:predicted NAD/FAD-binding protein